MGRYGREYGRSVGAAVIKGLGGKVTPEKMRFFDAWARAEGTSAGYNPFATTRRGYAGETQFNPVGVKNYPDLQTGIKATLDTLNLQYYTEIVNLLRSPDASAEALAKAVAASPWGTGTGVLRVLGVHDAEGYEKAKSTDEYGQNRASIEKHYITETLNRFAPSEGYKSFLASAPALAPLSRIAEGFQPFTRQTMVPASGGLQTGGDAGPSQGHVGFAPGTGKLYSLPYNFKGTHITDNLDLNHGQKTARDIILSAGTPLGAPAAGTVEQWGSAQGGEALYFRADDGSLFWMGHIDERVPVGTHLEQGEYIARISADHATPHVHIDRTVSRRRTRRKKK